MKKLQKIVISLSIFLISCFSNIFAIEKLLVADEGNQKIHFINLKDSTKQWFTSTSGNNRDMQLIGNNRVMVSTGGGFYEIDLQDGKIKKSVTSYSNVTSARRLPNNKTYLAAGNKIIIVDTAGTKLQEIALQQNVARLMRVVSTGTFIYGNADYVIESNDSGKMKWNAKINVAGGGVYQALRLNNGLTWASCGYGKAIVCFNAQKTQIKVITFPDSVKPNFIGGFQILPNGHIVTSNWQGHGGGNGGKGYQIIEVDTSSGKVVWCWKQDSTKISSLHGVLVIDDVNTNILHTEINGVLEPAPQTNLNNPHKNNKNASHGVNYQFSKDKIQLSLKGQSVEDINSRGLGNYKFTKIKITKSGTVQ